MNRIERFGAASIVACALLIGACSDGSSWLDDPNAPDPTPEPDPIPLVFALTTDDSVIFSWEDGLEIDCSIQGVEPAALGVAFRIGFNRDVLEVDEEWSFQLAAEHTSALTFCHVERDTLHIGVTAIDGATVDGFLGTFRMTTVGRGLSVLEVEQSSFAVVDSVGQRREASEFDIEGLEITVR